MKNKLFIRLQGILLAGMLLVACSDDTWDKHYETDASLVSDRNLWTTIESMPELSSFAALLKEAGYDKLLSESQAYTVFAPDNAALAGLNMSGLEVKTELVENHIARFIIPASGDSPKYVYMLNSKRIKLTRQSDGYYFGDAAFANPAKDVVATNGIVHVLSNYEAFFPNIYEFLAKRSDLDSIRNFLYSYNRIVFNESASVPGSVVDGQMTYLDSVFVNYNELISRLGYINREDSSYVILAPNNAAWTEAYGRIKNDFVYYNEKKDVADSLQRVNTCFAMLQDLVFSNTVQPSPQDSMTSTSRNTFYEPQYLFDGAEQVTTSNGTVFIANQLKYKPYESWIQPIKVEAERALGRENTLSNTDTRRVEGATIPVSGGRYLQLTPTTATGNPTVTFEIPNTLSSVYNIYCVFVTPKVNNPNAVGLKPCKVYFNLYYTDDTGETKTDRFPASGTVETNPNVMDTVLITPNFKFPTANYREEKTTVRLRAMSNVSRTETTSYSRELLIDCLLLEPKKD